MDRLDLIQRLSVKTDSKILFLILDGLGGTDWPEKGGTELQVAKTPNLDRLAGESTLGLMDPISPGITPGSGPGHLGLFGYDSLKYDIGRGVLAALGIGFDLQKSDVAARGNFCTVDDGGAVTDRRAGRIATEINEDLCETLAGIEVDGAQFFVKPVKDHRCMVVVRGEGLNGSLSDSDPQQEGLKPLPVKALDKAAEITAGLVNRFLEIVAERLKGRSPANMMLMRGFDNYPDLPQMKDVFRLNPAAIAVYPDYKGICRLIGMEILETGQSVADEVETLKGAMESHDFVYLHVKKTDSYGEDGNFEGKVKVIEEVDALLPQILDMKPDVLVVTGDHSTPSVLKAHSWHPLPLLVHSQYARRSGATAFDERACAATAGLGRIPAVDLMPTAMANALKLKKYGA